MSSISSGSGSGSISNFNQLLHTVTDQVEALSQEVSKTGSTLPKGKTEQFAKSLVKQAESLTKASSKSDFFAKAGKIDGKALDRLARALVSIGQNPHIIRNLNKPESGNIGNILLSIGEEVDKLKQKKQESKIVNKKYRVEKYEVIEFLNSTEKHFEQFVFRVLEKDAKQDDLIKFLMDLLRKMEVFKALYAMKFTHKTLYQTDSKVYKRLLKYIESLLSDNKLTSRLRELGLESEQKNAHLRLWKALHQLKDLL